MSRTDKDVPWKHRIFGRKKRHGRLMREVHLTCGNKWCCGFNNDLSSARARERRQWQKEITNE
jgi:hypothetical protein